MSDVQKIKVQITPEGKTCQDCELLIFSDMGYPPYCAAGFHLVDLGGYPKRPQQCLDASAQEKAWQDRVWYLEQKIEHLRRGACYAAHPGETTLECDATNPCPNCRLRRYEDRDA